jgi:hypothetical protein
MTKEQLAPIIISLRDRQDKLQAEIDNLKRQWNNIELAVKILTQEPEPKHEFNNPAGLFFPIDGEYRPLLIGEKAHPGDEFWRNGTWFPTSNITPCLPYGLTYRTKRPLP